MLEHIKIEANDSKDMTTLKSPYGSGDAANKIAEIVEKIKIKLN